MASSRGQAARCIAVRLRARDNRAMPCASAVESPSAEELAAWAAQALGAARAELVPLPVEASTRRFFRVSGAAVEGSFIAMHSPPATEHNPRFARLARRFRAHGLHTPAIHATDFERGFVLMEDLGETDFAAAYGRGDVDAPLDAALRALAALQRMAPDGIPPYTVERLRDELGIFDEWLVGRFLGCSLRPLFAATADALIDATQSVPSCVVHRDYHCRNLIWRGDGSVGIVDFQDALVGPACYDIASLLRDCYHVFDERAVRRWRRRFHEMADIDCPADIFERAFDLTAIQRQLKAVGIFARLHLRLGRPSHVRDIVPVLRRIESLGRGYPETAELAAWIEAEVLPRAAERVAALS